MIKQKELEQRIANLTSHNEMLSKQIQELTAQKLRIEGALVALNEVKIPAIPPKKKTEIDEKK